MWILFIFVLPLIGILIYMIARPKMTEQDKEMMMQAQEAQRRAQGYSPADEVAKLAKLRDEGKITAEEYEEQKKRAMMSSVGLDPFPHRSQGAAPLRGAALSHSPGRSGPGRIVHPVAAQRVP